MDDSINPLLGKVEHVVVVETDTGEMKEGRWKDGRWIDEKGIESKQFDIKFFDCLTRSHECVIKVVAYYDVDFGRRNVQKDYQEMLKSHGVVLFDIVLEDGRENLAHLTYADYVNEHGLSEEEHDKRMMEFWNVSRYEKDIPYQLVLETPLRNMTTAGIPYPNNYSTGDIYGDVFVTKSVLDSLYDMNIRPMDDKATHFQAKGREYLGIGQCSSQLFLTFKPTKVEFGDGISPATQRASKSDRDEDLGDYRHVEVVKNMNRFESSIKHKPNVFSIVVQNSNLAPNPNPDLSDKEKEMEDIKKSLRDSVTQFVRNACESTIPAHTQLFDVQFN